MQRAKRESCKFKVDPGFHIMIKTYVKELLVPLEKLPKGGQLSLSDELGKLVLNSSGWHSSYIEDKPKFVGCVPRTINIYKNPLVRGTHPTRLTITGGRK